MENFVNFFNLRNPKTFVSSEHLKVGGKGPPNKNLKLSENIFAVHRIILGGFSNLIFPYPERPFK